MGSGSIGLRWSSWAPQFLSVVRIVTAVLFMVAGTMKLFAFPFGMPPDGGTATLLSEVGLAGILETFGGALLVVGLFTKPTAFLLSGEMAVAYFQFHAPQGFWPNLNGGLPALMYCFFWLYLSAAGPGRWSVDEWRRKDNRQ